MIFRIICKITKKSSIKKKVYREKSFSKIFFSAKIFTNKDETRALIFDSTFDSYRGVVASVRVFQGEISAQNKLKLLRSGSEMSPTEVGFLSPKYNSTKILSTGEVGYIVTGLKNVIDARVGDTLWKKI